jgi:hypothetical protein
MSSSSTIKPPETNQNEKNLSDSFSAENKSLKYPVSKDILIDGFSSADEYPVSDEERRPPAYNSRYVYSFETLMEKRRDKRYGPYIIGVPLSGWMFTCLRRPEPSRHIIDGIYRAKQMTDFSVRDAIVLYSADPKIYQACTICGAGSPVSSAPEHLTDKCEWSKNPEKLHCKYCYQSGHQIVVCPVLHHVCQICSLRGHPENHCPRGSKDRRNYLIRFEKYAKKGHLTSRQFAVPQLGVFGFPTNFAALSSLPFSYESLLNLGIRDSREFLLEFNVRKQLSSHLSVQRESLLRQAQSANANLENLQKERLALEKRIMEESILQRRFGHLLPQQASSLNQRPYPGKRTGYRSDSVLPKRGRPDVSSRRNRDQSQGRPLQPSKLKDTDSVSLSP